MTTPQFMTPASEWAHKYCDGILPIITVIEQVQAEARRCGYEEARKQAQAALVKLPVSHTYRTDGSARALIGVCDMYDAIAALQPVDAGEKASNMQTKEKP